MGILNKEIEEFNNTKPARAVAVNQMKPSDDKIQSQDNKFEENKYASPPKIESNEDK